MKYLTIATTREKGQPPLEKIKETKEDFIKDVFSKESSLSVKFDSSNKSDVLLGEHFVEDNTSEEVI